MTKSGQWRIKVMTYRTRLERFLQPRDSWRAFSREDAAAFPRESLGHPEHEARRRSVGR